MDASEPTAEAIAYNEDGEIIALGSRAEVLAVAGTKAKLVSLPGSQVLPGFQDVHLHAVEAGINEDRCLLTEFGTIVQYRQEIAACAADQSSSPWFIGAGVSMPDLISRTARPVDLLDQLVPDKPALILDNLGHGAWANSTALATVGYDSFRGNPQGGLIDRDSAGAPTGIVYENAQQALRTAALPANAANRAANLAGLKSALRTLAQNGITSVSDAGGYWTRGHQEAWAAAEAEGAMTVRASNAFYVYPDMPREQQIADIIALRSGTSESLVRFDQVKIYVDGIISQGTAALNAPYTNDPEVADVPSNGFEYFNRADLFEYVKRFDEAGFSIHFHATGDRGVKLALDAIEAARSTNGETSNRHRITHLFLVDEADIVRFSQLNVVADVQLTPSSTARETIDFYRTIIGSRADNIISVASFLKSGADVTISSDWDTDELSPLVKIELAVRRSGQNVPDVITAIRLMTLAPAELLGHADRTGSLIVGKQADLVILDKNILTLPARDIDTAKVIGTVMGGRAVYDPRGLFGS